MADAGKRLFAQRACAACHNDTAGSIGPSLTGAFGRTEQLEDGSSIVIDEEYLLESIQKPQEKIVAGFPPSMPTYDTLLTEQEILQLVEYVKSLE